MNDMQHILRAHQLCMEGYSVLFDDELSTVWSAPNYCYRCGNNASILEVGPNGQRHFNVFEAAPENERWVATLQCHSTKQSNRDGPLQIQNQEAREVCKMKHYDTVFAYKHLRLATSYDRNDIAHV